MYDKKQIEEWASKRADDAGRLSRQLLATMQREARYREALEAFAKPPEIVPEGLDENDCCVCCGFSHQKAAAFAKQALSTQPSE